MQIPDRWWQCERCKFVHFETDQPQQCSVCHGHSFVKVVPTEDEARGLDCAKRAS